jgi:hypothetical protein
MENDPFVVAIGFTIRHLNEKQRDNDDSSL